MTDVKRESGGERAQPEGEAGVAVNDWAGTAAVVTGASSGIGRQIAVALAGAGTSHLLIHYHHNRAGAQQTADLVSQNGAAATLVQADLAESEDVTRLVAEAWQAAPRIQTWVHNAGADVLTGAAAHWDFFAKLDRLWQVDVRGTIRLARLVAVRMLEQAASPPPSMVFIGWDQATEGMESEAGQMFGPTKAAVMAFAASMAQSLAPAIRINTVAPGWIQTAWGETTDEYWNRRARAESLMDRWGTPEDVAAAVLYAAHPGHTFVTGAVLQVNGGWSRRFSPRQ